MHRFFTTALLLNLLISLGSVSILTPVVYSDTDQSEILPEDVCKSAFIAWSQQMVALDEGLDMVAKVDTTGRITTKLYVDGSTSQLYQLKGRLKWLDVDEDKQSARYSAIFTYDPAKKECRFGSGGRIEE